MQIRVNIHQNLYFLYTYIVCLFIKYKIGTDKKIGYRFVGLNVALYTGDVRHLIERVYHIRLHCCNASNFNHQFLTWSKVVKNLKK